MMFSRVRVLVGISAGVAAYKACELIRQLKHAGAVVRVILTEGATQFVTPLQCQALTGEPVYGPQQTTQAHHAMDHIELARWATVICIVPATANIIARLSMGMADDLLTTVCLATQAPVIVAPAMNQQMWQHAATQHNVHTLTQRGVHCLTPPVGEQACGEVGPGRLPELVDILQAIQSHVGVTQSLAGEHVLVTAGPTREPIDPVRYLSNASSGRMGYALAEAAERRGATVSLVSGPCLCRSQFNPEVHSAIHLYSVETALEMRDQVLALIPTVTLFIAAAAVSDYRVSTPAQDKLKKSNHPLTQLDLVENPDIVKTVTSMTSPPFSVGFAAETSSVIAHAQAKRIDKKLDVIIANQVGRGLGMEQADIAVTIIDREGQQQTCPLANKSVIAEQIMAYLQTRL